MHIFDASLSFLCVINSFSSCVCASLSSMCTMKKVGYKYSKVLFTPNSFIPSFVETFIEGIVCARHWGYRDTGKRNPHADRRESHRMPCVLRAPAEPSRMLWEHSQEAPLKKHWDSH